MIKSHPEKRRIAMISVGRSDFSIYLPILRAAKEFHSIDLNLIASGSHLRAEHGMTVSFLREAGFEPSACIDFLLPSDSKESVTTSIARGVEQFGKHFQSEKYDLIVVLGDRFEMMCPVLASLPYRIPIAHIHGGEETVGAFDNQIRHAITKLSHLHFASTKEYQKRIVQMGEYPTHVIHSGAPALDTFVEFEPLSETELCKEFGFTTLKDAMLFTYHPETLSEVSAEEEAKVLCAILSKQPGPVIVTAPNPDPGGMILKEAFERLSKSSANICFRETLGTTLYYSLLFRAALVVGNSSSGIIEAPSAKIPVVNIGDRQEGRIRALNVIDSPLDGPAINGAIAKARSAKFRESLSNLVNPYWNGGASKIILTSLVSVPLGTELLRKHFYFGPSAV